MTDETSASIKDFEVFKEAMIKEDLEVQIDITKRLTSLAKLLGAQVTRDELLPLINDNIDFHNEILLHLSDQLQHFIPLVGGFEHSKCVLDLLAKLCNTDENIVRGKAVDTLKKIGSNLTQKQTEKLFLPIVENLSNEEWFTGKCSACELYRTCYPNASNEKKAELRNSFRVLIQDESPIVRRSAAISCVDFVECLEPIFIKNEFIPVFDNVVNDQMDSVKTVAVDLAVALSKVLSLNEIDEFLFKTIESWTEDCSWRLRQRLAAQISILQKCISHPKTRGRILSIFQKLSKDSEPEVRVIMAENLRNYCESLKETYASYPQFENNFEPVFEGSVMPHISRLLNDEVEAVRLALSSNILSLSSVLSEACFKKNILPLLVQILEHEPSMKMQANVLQSLNYLPSSIDVTQSLHSIKNVIRSIIVNSQTHWRTRRSILIAFAHVAKFSSTNYFETNLKVFYAALLGDQFFAIRRTAPIILPVLATQYGINWAAENLIPYFTMFVRDCRYLYRYVPLFGISELIRPTLSAKTEYLKSLQKLAEKGDKDLQAKASIKLAKLEKLFRKVQSKVEEQRHVDMLLLHEEINNFKTDDVHLYAEDTLDAFKNNDIDIFNITEERIKNESCLYLEGILKLLYNDFFKIIQILFNDPVENVQIRSIYTLYLIKQFLEELNSEFSQSWVQTNLQLFSKEEIEEIDKYLEEELKKDMLTEVDDEHIDAELTETILNGSNEELPDLGVDIPELDHFGVKKENFSDALENVSEVGQPMQIEIIGNRKTDNFIPETKKSSSED